MIFSMWGENMLCLKRTIGDTSPGEKDCGRNRSLGDTLSRKV